MVNDLFAKHMLIHFAQSTSILKEQSFDLHEHKYVQQIQRHYSDKIKSINEKLESISLLKKQLSLTEDKKEKLAIINEIRDELRSCVSLFHVIEQSDEYHEDELKPIEELLHKLIVLLQEKRKEILS